MAGADSFSKGELYRIRNNRDHDQCAKSANCTGSDPNVKMSGHSQSHIIKGVGGISQMSDWLRSMFRTSKDKFQVFQAHNEALEQGFSEFEKSYEALVKERDEIQTNLKKVTNEKLALLDRHSPISDEEISTRFKDVTLKIYAFINQEIMANPQKIGNIIDVLMLPDTNFPGSVLSPLDDTFKNKNNTRKHLLVNAIWKHFSETLFDRSKPFQSFSWAVAAELNGLYPIMYPKHDVTTEATKWKTMTVRGMEAANANNEKSNKIIQLATEFVDRFCYRGTSLAHTTADPATLAEDENEIQGQHPDEGKMKEPTEDATDQDAVQGKEQLIMRLLDENSSLGRRFVRMASAAVGLSRTVARQRAGYSVMMPNMSTRNPIFIKKLEDEALDTSVDMKVGLQTMENREGMVLYIVTPCFVKWGTGFGERLEEPSVLVKGFPRMVEVDEAKVDQAPEPV